jgi:hypothetical protein
MRGTGVSGPGGGGAAMGGLGLDGPAELGGVEGIYGVEALPLRWSAG